MAIAWQVYALSNAPTALSVVGVAWTLPTVVFLLVGGAISDHRERRRLLLTANLVEAMAIGLIPLSFAITGPTAQALGPMTTLLGAGCLGGAAMIAFLAVPGVRDPKRSMSTGPSS